MIRVGMSVLVMQHLAILNKCMNIGCSHLFCGATDNTSQYVKNLLLFTIQLRFATQL